MQSFKEQQGKIRKPYKQCEQCKETKENNRIEKTRDLFKKVRDTKGPFHAKIGIRDRNSMDLTEAEDIKDEAARMHRSTQKIS